jgi:hypothetical protein
MASVAAAAGAANGRRGPAVGYKRTEASATRTWPQPLADAASIQRIERRHCCACLGLAPGDARAAFSSLDLGLWLSTPKIDRSTRNAPRV